MNALRTLFLLATCLSVGESLNQFRKGIQCLVPDSSPVLDYSHYGCYCGWGGSGTPVDKLDRCCQVHDKCYDDAKQLEQCWGIFDNPYTEVYAYSCDEASKMITCGENNNACEMFICECDRKAADCFARSPYNAENKRLPSERCQ
ncbi:phospholipase A2-like [Limanda limanda]|uniref:phospholipase A2-like n=1 Tax=Limanda limanda TaxID=27771 RepID=UPI0029C8BE42|nr:phospholipase A2-like [Limanda limanda]